MENFWTRGRRLGFLLGSAVLAGLSTPATAQSCSNCSSPQPAAIAASLNAIGTAASFATDKLAHLLETQEAFPTQEESFAAATDEDLDDQISLLEDMTRAQKTLVIAPWSLTRMEDQRQLEIYEKELAYLKDLRALGEEERAAGNLPAFDGAADSAKDVLGAQVEIDEQTKERVDALREAAGIRFDRAASDAFVPGRFEGMVKAASDLIVDPAR